MLLFILITLSIFVALLVMLEMGRRIGQARKLGNLKVAGTADLSAGLAAVDGAIFALMGLLIAFTFSGAASRFEGRRDLITRETNNIGTAWLRVDLLPAAVQPAIRQHFRDYLDARLAFYHNLEPDPAAAQVASARADTLQGQIWNESVTSCVTGCPSGGLNLVVTSINDMIDITTTRNVALETHPPLIIYLATVLLVLASSLLAGYNMASSVTRPLLHMLLFAAVLSASLYVILDLEYPRVGIIRIDSMDHVLIELRATM